MVIASALKIKGDNHSPRWIFDKFDGREGARSMEFKEMLIAEREKTIAQITEMDEFLSSDECEEATEEEKDSIRQLISFLKDYLTIVIKHIA